MQKVTVLLALLAGLAGGIVSHYLLPERVQTAASTAVPNVVAAQRFVLVDTLGSPAGFFAVGTPSSQKGGETIILYDAQGRELWYASDAMLRSRPLTQ
jgi:hypothetical protein